MVVIKKVQSSINLHNNKITIYNPDIKYTKSKTLESKKKEYITTKADYIIYQTFCFGAILINMNCQGEIVKAYGVKDDSIDSTTTTTTTEGDILARYAIRIDYEKTESQVISYIEKYISTAHCLLYNGLPQNLKLYNVFNHRRTNLDVFQLAKAIPILHFCMIKKHQLSKTSFCKHIPMLIDASYVSKNKMIYEQELKRTKEQAAKQIQERLTPNKEEFKAFQMLDPQITWPMYIKLKADEQIKYKSIKTNI